MADVKLKITTVGDVAVGKTSLLVIFAKILNELPYYVTSIYEDYTYGLTIDDKDFELTLIDTAGQEDYDRLRPLSYPNTDCFLICYSIADRASFSNAMSKWYPEIRRYSATVPIILVGTKSDLRISDSEDFVSLAEAVKMKEKIKAVDLIECSTTNKQNVDKVFQEAIRLAIEEQLEPETCICAEHPCTIL